MSVIDFSAFQNDAARAVSTASEDDVVVVLILRETGALECLRSAKATPITFFGILQYAMHAAFLDLGRS